MKEKIKEILKKIIFFIINPRFLFCFGIAWIITNGWSYAMFTIGMFFDIGWMIALSSAYLAFLWLPVSPEKLVTIAIAMFLLKWLFPNDEKTLGRLKEMHTLLKGKHDDRKARKKARKESKDGKSDEDTDSGEIEKGTDNDVENKNSENEDNTNE